MSLEIENVLQYYKFINFYFRINNLRAVMELRFENRHSLSNIILRRLHRRLQGVLPTYEAMAAGMDIIFKYFNILFLTILI
jgi:hypothetical protein